MSDCCLSVAKFLSVLVTIMVGCFVIIRVSLIDQNYEACLKRKTTIQTECVLEINDLISESEVQSPCNKLTTEKCYVQRVEKEYILYPSHNDSFRYKTSYNHISSCNTRKAEGIDLLVPGSHVCYWNGVDIPMLTHGCYHVADTYLIRTLIVGGLLLFATWSIALDLDY